VVGETSATNAQAWLEEPGDEEAARGCCVGVGSRGCVVGRWFGWCAGFCAGDVAGRSQEMETAAAMAAAVDVERVRCCWSCWSCLLIVWCQGCAPNPWASAQRHMWAQS
jgi:hypothetical protein